MQNPFESINLRLSNIENLLLDIKHNPKHTPEITVKDVSENRTRYMTLTEIFKHKLISKPTFYKHLREGKITMYKLGGRSYVDKTEFESAFTKVEISNK